MNNAYLNLRLKYNTLYINLFVGTFKMIAARLETGEVFFI